MCQYRFSFALFLPQGNKFPQFSVWSYPSVFSDADKDNSVEYLLLDIVEQMYIVIGLSSVNIGGKFCTPAGQVLEERLVRRDSQTFALRVSREQRFKRALFNPFLGKLPQLFDVCVEVRVLEVEEKTFLRVLGSGL